MEGALPQGPLNEMNSYPSVPRSLYSAEFEHDACGVGFVANIHGTPEHRIVRHALEALESLSHRGALDADAKTGDGAGILVQVPRSLLHREAARLGAAAVAAEDLAVAMVFLPRSLTYLAARGRRLVEQGCAAHGIHFLGWRVVPVNPRCLGDKAASTQPDIQQAILARDPGWSSDEFERRLFLARRHAEEAARREDLAGFYIPSMSSRTVVYKGLFNAPQLPSFYPDLRDPAFVSALALFHQRYSTNTFPTWNLAHPFRRLAHNGEINTLLGNRNWTRARERELEPGIWGPHLHALRPILQPGGSDSAALDNALETLELSGRDLLHAVMMLAPEAWENRTDMSPAVRDFYQYHACLNEPWDGPAAVVFSDGRWVGATLDRNGLRPARFKVYDDGLVVMGSEFGLVDLDERRVIRKGRLGPGRILAIDTAEGRLFEDDEVKALVAQRQPYGEWVRQNAITLAAHVQPTPPDPVDPAALTLQQLAFGWDVEQVEDLLKPMATAAAEPVGSMGDDTPFAVLSRRPRLLFDYFKQLFAQVTNPPIDPIREKRVMSLAGTLGRRRSWFDESPLHARQVLTASPILDEDAARALRSLPGFPCRDLSVLFDAAGGPEAMDAALTALARAAEAAVDDGAVLLWLSDRGVTAGRAAIPMLAAVGAVHHHLIRAGKRLRCSIACESGEARDVHHFACLIGYGASAVLPYVALAAIRSAAATGAFAGITPAQGESNYRKAVENGLLKVFSKMGISTLASYQGAQVFEAIGLGHHLVDRCFHGTTSHVGGIHLGHVAIDTLRRHQVAFAAPIAAVLDVGGHYRVAKGGKGEFHAYNPQVVLTLHRFLKSGAREEFVRFMETVEKREPVSPRDLLRFKPTGQPVPLEDVEPITEIRRRFTTAGMSLGALSPEAHECLAVAMNSIGGKSNSGEGGEDPARYSTHRNSAIKQVASGRFGVTPAYLASAHEIEIKMAQGAKPGEGGQLPGHKVTPLIALLRHSVPGVPLISPPPHHDIYSIEDLSQLVYDLKQVNPRAKVCVKLVARAGVGTVAAGVAKAYADVILVSGHDGGTGASPLTSIKNTGGPWEFGVAEAQQTLVLNDLRSRVVLRTDGGMKTGRDIVVAALLGAEEFNFGTAALVAAGCAMFRVCHLNTCPVGVATQREDLRAKFKGKPENVVAYFDAIAQEVREILASLGFRRLDDVIGRTDLLGRRPAEELPPEVREKASTLDIDRLLAVTDPTGDAPRLHTRERNERFGDSPLDDRILTEGRLALQGRGLAKLDYKVTNLHRNVGTRVSGHIAYIYGDGGLPSGSALDITLRGSSGQSLGTFLAHGVNLTLVGEANDYVGKGMNGGRIVVRPPDAARFPWAGNVIAGNTCLYGATGGEAFIAGTAGERFAVRNSGAVAVVEGVGDHGCEYMTGGAVLVLGDIGDNFAAGMSGGRAWAWDPGHHLPSRCNPGMVSIQELSEADAAEVHRLLARHLELTSSPRAAEILASWPASSGHFKAVVPKPPEKPAPAPTPPAHAPASP